MNRVDEIIELFKWNFWANDKYRSIFANYSLEALSLETPYGNLLDRIIHIFASFKMWHQRMIGESPKKVLSGEDFESWQEIQDTWIEYETLILDYVSNLAEKDLDRTVSYTSLDGTTYSRQIRHILLHLTMHQNYHRGQISAIFKINHLTPLPATDMVIYFLEQ